MDRPRRAGAARHRAPGFVRAIRRPGRSLTIRHATRFAAGALLALAAGCQGYSTDFSAPVAVAIETTRLPPFQLEEQDTMRVTVVVLNRAGDTVPGQGIQLVSLNPDTITVDSALSALVGVTPGQGRVVAFAGNLSSAVFAVSVVRAPDSIAVFDSTGVDSVPVVDSVSPAITAQLLDARTDSGQVIGLAWSDTIHFAIVYPVFAAQDSATVLLGDTALVQAVATSAVPPAGTASVVVRRTGRTWPDSVVVQATAHRAVGTVVRGSPVRFVLYPQQ